jgi:hypothetical protein
MAAESLEPNGKRTVSFHYIKSNSFRVVYVEGALGGPTPRGNISVSVFNERAPIPQKNVFEVLPTGELGAELVEQRISRDGVVREVEVELVFTVESAKTFAEWLAEHVRRLEKAQRKDG